MRSDASRGTVGNDASKPERVGFGPTLISVAETFSLSVYRGSHRRFHMHLKTLVGFFVVVLIGVTFTGLFLPKSPSNAVAIRSKSDIQLEVIQLPADKGIIPVAIQGERISTNPVEDTREAVFAVKNNTSKNINAISVAVTVKFEDNGKESSSTHYLTRNSLVHLDIRKIHHQSPLAPEQEWSFGTEALDPEAPAVLRAITLQIDYLEFDDKTWLGPDKFGSNFITSVRAGAAKYKAWLQKKYAENGRSVNALLPFLARGEALPAEINLSGHEKVGARHYKSHLLLAYQQHGIEEVQKYLSR